MKKICFYFPTVSFALSALFIFSCGNNDNNKGQKTESGSDFLKNQAPAYDPSVIDPKAPVMEIQLHSSGNTMAEMKFDKDTISVDAGSTIRLTFVNGSVDMSMMHNFVVVDTNAVQTVADLGLKAGKEHDFVPDHPSVYVHTKMTLPGEQTTVTFAAPPAGIYKFICTYPGHYSKMQGWFIVG